jgi:ubiquinone/menaquinone biosynthesis C-methylase UbiE
MNGEKNEVEFAERMLSIARTTLKDVYPTIAGQSLSRFGRRSGVFLDIGGGPGSLAVAMARMSEFSVITLDISPEMTRLAWKTAADANLAGRIRAIVGSVEKMPIESGSIDLAMSRGSSFAWEDKPTAFAEIKRVLAPGGKAFIGVGCIFGTREIRERAVAEFLKEDPDWEKGAERRECKLTFGDVDELCAKAGIRSYEKLTVECDKWLVISGDDPA